MKTELETLRAALKLDPGNPFLAGHVAALTAIQDPPPRDFKNEVWNRWRTSFQHGNPGIMPCDNCGLINWLYEWEWDRQIDSQRPLLLCHYCKPPADAWKDRQRARGNLHSIFATTPITTDTLESAIVPIPYPHPCHCEGSRAKYTEPQELEFTDYEHLLRCQSCARTYLLRSEAHPAVRLARALDVEPLKSELADPRQHMGDLL